MTRTSLLLVALAGALLASPTHAGQVSWRQAIAEKLAALREGRVDRPLLHRQQLASLRYVYYRAHDGEQRDALERTLPDEAEQTRFRAMREGVESEALDLLDEFYGVRDGLKALAVRDTDGDGIPDYRVSDYYGKFSEGDIDVDGDGVRNVYDDHPYDPAKGGRDADGDGIPDDGFVDQNSNGLPDHLDWGIHGRDPELVRIQLGLFRDHKIILVERNAEFDLALARAVDDVARRVLRRYFQEEPVLPTLRTVAVEKTALLNALLALVAEDTTSAQVFSQTQSLTVYGPGRETADDLGLLGLLAHEIGHSYHMSLDWDAAHPERENQRTDFPVPHFVKLVARFGWTPGEYYDGQFGDDPPRPLFLYTGMSEPTFLLKGKTPDEWEGWLNAIYEKLGEPEDYLEHASFAEEAVVGDYSLSTPYEWYGDNLLAYVVHTLEEFVVDRIRAESGAQGADAAVAAARQGITDSLRAVWPAFYHRNIGPEALAYFGETFPISEDDRRALVERYIDPVIP
ncbi:MAG: hypothetical protein LJF30_18630 [Acidobacteria bacterium]|jgi:hypothetical protein|nr:hypothetical protein [Acidobacteriota bacterium]